MASKTGASDLSHYRDREGVAEVAGPPSILTESIRFINIIVMLDVDHREVAASGALAPAGRPWSRRPPSVPPWKLLRLARAHAARVRSWAQQSDLPLGERRYELLRRTADFELWLIHWPTDRGLVLHDHGGSAGAFHVVAGALDETSTALGGGTLRLERLFRPAGKAFGPSYVHSVVNSERAAATSVHAYSPPLTSMGFYQSTPRGLVLSRVETHWEGAP